MVSFKLQKSQTSVGNVVFTLSWVSAKMEHEGGAIRGSAQLYHKSGQAEKRRSRKQKSKKTGKQISKKCPKQKKRNPPKKPSVVNGWVFLSEIQQSVTATKHAITRAEVCWDSPLQVIQKGTPTLLSLAMWPTRNQIQWENYRGVVALTTTITLGVSYVSSDSYFFMHYLGEINAQLLRELWGLRDARPTTQECKKYFLK